MKADILACYGTTWIDKLIQLFTKNKISHAVIVFDDNDKIVINTLWYGVTVTKFPNVPFMRLRCIELTDEQRHKIIDIAISKIGTPYDFKLLVGLGLNIILNKLGLKIFETNWDSPYKYICVETIIESYRQVGIDLLPQYYDRDIRPDSLKYSEKLIEINKS